MRRKHNPGCPCCVGEFCNTHYSAPEVPFSLWVDIPVLGADTGCSEACGEAIEGTYRLDFTGSLPTNCSWGSGTFTVPSCCAGLCDVVANITAGGILQAGLGMCVFIGEFGEEFTWTASWTLDITPSVSIINHTLDPFGISGTGACDITGTTVDIYEVLNRVFCTSASLVMTGHQATIT